MLRTTTLIFAAWASVGQAQPAPPWENDWPADVVWAWQTPDGSRYYSLEEDIDRNTGLSGEIRVWVHGMHSQNPSVPYRRTVVLLRMGCSGGYVELASTAYKADGSVLESWDGQGPYTYIRPGSAYESLEEAVCKSE